MFWVNWKRKYEILVVEDLIRCKNQSYESKDHSTWFEALDKVAEEMGIDENTSQRKRYYQLINFAREGYWYGKLGRVRKGVFPM